MYFYCKESAFTLIELIVTIAVLAIITTLALPHFRHFQAKQEAENVNSLIRQHINSAKSIASVHHLKTIVCSSNSSHLCADNQWNSGIIIFGDKNNNKQIDLDEKVYSQVETNLHFGKLTWKGSSSSDSELTFQGDTGLPRGAPGSFIYCSQDHTSLNKRFNISRMGHVRPEATSC